MSDLAVVIAILGGYMVSLLVIGWLAYRKTMATPAGYFLADRSIGPFVLAFTMFASIFSALTFLGAAGFGYSFGPGWFMAQGTGNALLAITLYIVGKRVWYWGQRFSFLTPAELLAARFRSERVRDLFTIVFFVTTIPYLAIQPIGAGFVFSQLTDGAISFEAGATTLLVIMVAYLLLGGLRGVAWSDTLQGVMLLSFLVITLGVVASAAGGLSNAASSLQASNPDLFTRPGPGDFWTQRNIIGWWLIFVSNVAVQPLILLRFMSARNISTIRTSAIAWPVLGIIVAFGSTFVGLFGRVLEPGLEAADQIVPTLLANHAPLWLAALILSGAMAAMMSSGDSLLHYAGASATGDVYQRYVKKDASARQLTWVGRIAIIIVAFLGWLIALSPPEFILDLGAATFTAIGVLMPAVVGILYWRRCTVAGVAVSVLLAETYVLGAQFGVIPASWNLGFGSIFNGLLLAVAGLLVGSALSTAQSDEETAAFFPVRQESRT